MTYRSQGGNGRFPAERVGGVRRDQRKGGHGIGSGALCPFTECPCCFFDDFVGRVVQQGDQLDIRELDGQPAHPFSHLRCGIIQRLSEIRLRQPLQPAEGGQGSGPHRWRLITQVPTGSHLVARVSGKGSL